MKQDDLVKLMAAQPDFKEVKTIIEEELEAVGAAVLFGVKFHPGKLDCDSHVADYVAPRGTQGVAL
jgi:hypothetical protein